MNAACDLHAAWEYAELNKKELYRCREPLDGTELVLDCPPASQRELWP